MTDAIHLCRHCDQPITDPKDAVLITQEAGNSGPGWNVRAHRQHANRIGHTPWPSAPWPASCSHGPSPSTIDRTTQPRCLGPHGDRRARGRLP